jgi:hypothetical protein
MSFSNPEFNSRYFKKGNLPWTGEQNPLSVFYENCNCHVINNFQKTWSEKLERISVY